MKKKITIELPFYVYASMFDALNIARLLVRKESDRLCDEGKLDFARSLDEYIKEVNRIQTFLNSVAKVELEIRKD